MISSADDNLQFPYLQTAGNENPKYKILEKYTNGINIMFFANNNVLKLCRNAMILVFPDILNRELTGCIEAWILGRQQKETDDENADLLSSVISKYLLEKRHLN